ncbi:hypothetical protein D9C73_021934 [Collichthys lucidus]|uniref:Uncharacterized protein n=1 Tax=Collichthys lucidus TaxID=240159 RepID=A0A4U5VJ17_COLLU|nr:hypothetical protein D9C73_021934 [Collichthys lucidus]
MVLFIKKIIIKNFAVRVFSCGFEYRCCGCGCCSTLWHCGLVGDNRHIFLTDSENIVYRKRQGTKYFSSEIHIINVFASVEEVDTELMYRML